MNEQVYKILVTTSTWGTAKNGQDQAGGVHTLVIGFIDAYTAKEAIETINKARAVMGIHQTAIYLGA